MSDATETRHKTVYDSTTGEIIFSMTYTATDNADPSDIPPGSAVIDGVKNPAEWYVNGGVFTKRPDFPTFADKDTILADGLDVVRFDNVPSNTEVLVNNDQLYKVTDGVFEYSTGNPGLHRFLFKAHPAVDQEFFINAS